MNIRIFFRTQQFRGFLILAVFNSLTQKTNAALIRETIIFLQIDDVILNPRIHIAGFDHFTG